MHPHLFADSQPFPASRKTCLRGAPNRTLEPSFKLDAYHSSNSSPSPIDLAFLIKTTSTENIPTTKTLPRPKPTRPSHEVHQASKIKNPKERINIGNGGGHSIAPPPHPPAPKLLPTIFPRHVSSQASPRRPSTPSPWTSCNQRFARDRYSVQPAAAGTRLVRFIPLARSKFRSLSAPAAHLFLASGFRWGDISSALPSGATSDTRTCPSPLLTTYTKSLRFLFCGWRVTLLVSNGFSRGW